MKRLIKHIPILSYSFLLIGTFQLIGHILTNINLLLVSGFTLIICGLILALYHNYFVRDDY